MSETVTRTSRKRTLIVVVVLTGAMILLCLLALSFQITTGPHTNVKNVQATVSAIDTTNTAVENAIRATNTARAKTLTPRSQ